MLSQCVVRGTILSRSLSRSHVLTTFLGPVLGAMMKQVCWHSRHSKAYGGLPEARGHSEAHGDSNLYNTMVGGPLAMVDGVAVGHCGAFWTCCLSKLRQFWQIRSLQNFIFGAVKHWPWTPRSCPPQLRWKIAAQLWSTCVMRRPFCVEVWWEDVQYTEPPWTYLNILKPILEQCMPRWTVRKPF